MGETAVGDYFKDWKEREAIAELMIPLIGKLYRDHEVICTVFDRNLVNQSTIEILRVHRFARQIINREIWVKDTYPILQVMAEMDLGPAKVDLAKLVLRYQEQSDQDIRTFVTEQLSGLNTGKGHQLSAPRDVVLYGFGRIGRLLARILIEQTGGGDKLRLRAAVVRKGSEDDLIKRASLLRHDSVHGPFLGTITVDDKENALVVNGNLIRIIYADSPEKVDYTAYGIQDAILIDNTGKWRDRKGLNLHLEA